MRYRRTIVFVVTALTFAAAAQSEAQVSLYPQVSAETNGMGGAGVSFVSDNALATIANPAELGLFSLHGMLTASYVTTTPNQLEAFAVSSGLTLNKLWHELPSSVGLGIGYTNPVYSYPSPILGIRTLTERDAVNGLTFGLGLDYLVKLGLGYTLKWATTDGNPKYYNSTYAPDWGVVLQIPLVVVSSRLAGRSVHIFRNMSPIINLTMGYSERNAGTFEINNLGAAGLPKEGDLGLNLEFGLQTHVNHHSWKWISFTWLRQANASLIALDSSQALSPNSSQVYWTYFDTYKRGLGDFRLSDNIVGGRAGGSISAVKGWQVQLCQFLYLRGGSDTEPGMPTYTTYGWGVRLDGLVNTLLFFHLLSPNNEIAKSLLDHFDLEFDYSKADGGPFQGEPFESLSLVVR